MKANLIYCIKISRKDTGLPADLMISFKIFGFPIKDLVPKLKVHTTDDYEQDFIITLEKQPKILIGENNILTDEELQQIFDYVTEHLEVLLEFWESDGKQDGKALYKKLRLYGEKK